MYILIFLGLIVVRGFFGFRRGWVDLLFLVNLWFLINLWLMEEGNGERYGGRGF